MPVNMDIYTSMGDVFSGDRPWHTKYMSSHFSRGYAIIGARIMVLDFRRVFYNALFHWLKMIETFVIIDLKFMLFTHHYSPLS